ncbi:MAG: cellulose biosynthesis cyclic di-GMP-binding regulatory protein BcsB [Roseinatronobacter sp.]
MPVAIFAQQASAQMVEGGIIPLPQTDTLELPVVPGPDNISARYDASRRGSGVSETVATDRQDRVSPLRLVDLGYPMTDGVVRVSGEREWVTFEVYGSARAESQILRLMAISGINNLPERSHVTVKLNGTDIGQRNLVHIETPGAIDFAIPPGLLQPGRNSVRVELRQHHRIYCGPEAAFDLWTDLDLSKSGILVGRDDAEAGIESFLMGLAAQATGMRPVEIRGLETLGGDEDTWRRFLVGRLNQVLSGAPVVFRFSDYWTIQENGPAHARITLMPAAQSQVRFVVSGDGAQVMVLEVAQGTKPADLLDMLPQLAARTQEARVSLVTPDRDVSFSEIGIGAEQFSQHYAIRNHAFRLPHDWLVLTAAKARLKLDYAYAPNLPEGAMLLLSMNGTSIRLLPLRREGGIPITAFPIDFEARLMHPGTNILTMQMFIPGNPPDLPCPAGNAPVLQIGAGSSLNVPYSPSMFISDMDLAFAAIGPESLRRNELSGRAYSDMDVLTLGAALTRTHVTASSATLHLIAIEDLGSIPTGHHRAERRLLEDALLSRPAPEMLVAEQSDQTDDLFQTRRPAARPFSAALSAGWDEVRDRLRWALERLFPSSGDQLNDWLETQRGHAIFFQLDPERPDEIWMLRNPDSDIHQIAQAIASARAVGTGPRGQVSVLTHEGNWNNWLAPDRRPMLLEPWSLQNFRAAMGNHVSARPIFYTILMLALALSSAAVALRLIISTREHKV